MASRLAFFAAATCALLVLATSASSPLPPPPAVHRAVEAGWWTTVPSAGNGTDETLTQWAERQRFHVAFHVGDVLDFKAWNGSVLLLARRGDYERCDTAASWGRQFESGGGGTDAGFVLYRPGIFYFASGVPGRCEAGLRMALRVAEAPFAPTSGVAPAPDERAVPAAPGDAAPPPAVVVKLTPSVWLWIATVGIFAVLFLFVILFCGIRQANLVKCFLDLPLPAPAGKLEALSSALATV